MRTTIHFRRWAAKAVAVLALTSVTACAPSFRNHGYIPPAEDLELIEVGADTRETVADKVGVPASSGVLNDSGYYYVRMRTPHYRATCPQRDRPTGGCDQLFGHWCGREMSNVLVWNVGRSCRCPAA